MFLFFLFVCLVKKASAFLGAYLVADAGTLCEFRSDCLGQAGFSLSLAPSACTVGG